jgi:DNA-binding transcriptional LysR family regulator
MDLQLIRSLVAVADTGSITDASDRIGLTQPALSRRLQLLEDQMGAQLFSRGRKGVQLTEIGRLVDKEARTLIARYDHLREQVRAHQGLEGGTVRIGGGATAVSFLLPEAIAAFQGSHPGVKFQLKEAGSNEVAEDVNNSRLELGLVTLPVKPRDLAVWPLLTDKIVLVGPRAHPLTHKRHINASALENLSFVGFEADTAVRQIIDARLRDAGVTMNVVMELRSIPAILRMVATTGNLAFVSQLGVDSLEEVVMIEVKDLKIERELAVIARRGTPLSPAAQAFSTLLREVVTDNSSLFS